MELFNRAFGRPLGKLFAAIVGGLGLGAFTQGVRIQNAAGSLIVRPLDQLATSIAALVAGIVGGAADFAGAGFAAAAQSVGPGGVFNLGPFTPALVVVGIGVTAYVVAVIRSEEATSNVFFFLPTDIPLIGTDEDDT